MAEAMSASARTPYAGLTPQTVLDALESVGFVGDGRLIALNSYENRVYLVYLEDADPVVVKFYRPNRWSDEQIAEEHALLEELHEDEVPAVARPGTRPNAWNWDRTSSCGLAGPRDARALGGFPFCRISPPRRSRP